jgi:branched-chain amino acid transport system substrate-binding protein
MKSQKNEVPLLLGSLLITGGILVGGYWWLTHQDGSSPGAGGNSVGTSVATSLSDGNQNLIATEAGSKDGFVQAKNDGVTAMGGKQYAVAVGKFAAALRSSSNAPETKIYFNNAKIGDGTSLKIAVAVPIKSDLNGSLEILRGVAQAQEEVNKIGGINGVPVKVVIADDAGQAETAVQVAQVLSKDPQVLGVIGHYASDASIAAAKVYDAAKLVSISPVSSSVKLTNLSRYVFRTVPSDYVSARALADYALQKLQRKQAIIFFNSQSGYSQSLKAEFATAMSLGGGAVVQEVDLSAADFSATKALNQAATADVIMLAANTGSLDRALQVVQANPKKLPILGGDDVYAPKTLEVGKQQALGLTVAVPWHIEAEPSSRFAQSSRQMWGAAVNWRTALAYDAAQSFFGALQQNPSRAGVKSALTANGFQATGGSGVVRFLASGDRNAGIQLVQVVAGKKSGYGFDFAPVKK